MWRRCVVVCFLLHKRSCEDYRRVLECCGMIMINHKKSRLKPSKRTMNGSALIIYYSFLEGIVNSLFYHEHGGMGII